MKCYCCGKEDELNSLTAAISGWTPYFGLAILFYDYIYAVDQRYSQNLVQMR